MIDLILGDFNEVANDFCNESFDLIYTDPPYSRQEATECFRMLAWHSYRLLKDGGSLVTIVPHYFLPEAIGIMNGSSLKYRWIYNMDQENGSHARMAMGIEVCWKPMLHYVKRAYPSGRGFLRDKVIISAPDKSLHEWQQSTDWAYYYIQKLTNPGDQVLDPFCGPATVPLVCNELNRNCTGVEKDEDVFTTGAERVALI